MDAFRAKAGRPPGLGIVLVGNDPASEIYVRNKVKAGGETGLWVDLQRLPASASLDDLLGLVERLNRSDAHDAILVQSPLPPGMGRGASQRVFDAIDPEKDVDGFHPVNVGRLVQGRAHLVPCTPSGVIEMLERSQDHDCRDARRDHRPQRDRRQADGDAAASSRRHRRHLSFEDAGPAVTGGDGGYPGGGDRPCRVRHRGVRQAGRDGRRRRHQPRDRRGAGRDALPSGFTAARGLRAARIGRRRRCSSRTSPASLAP